MEDFSAGLQVVLYHASLGSKKTLFADVTCHILKAWLLTYYNVYSTNIAVMNVILFVFSTVL